MSDRIIPTYISERYRKIMPVPGFHLCDGSLDRFPVFTGYAQNLKSSKKSRKMAVTYTV